MSITDNTNNYDKAFQEPFLSNSYMSTYGKKDLEREGVYKDPIVTEVTCFRNFYVAEDYHKNYYENNQNAPYCNFIIDPKVNKLLQKYRNNVKEEYIIASSTCAYSN